MDRPNWGKDPFTKFRKQRGNPQIGQPPGLIPKKGYPIFGLALLALHTPTVKTGRPAKQYIRREGLALFLRTGTEASVCDTVRARPCAGDYTLIMGDGHREPFRSWAAERAEATCFDMSRFDAIPPSTRGGNRHRGREAAWDARRRHAPCPQRIVPSWGMDCIYLRTPAESDYVQALWAYTAQNPAVGEVAVGREYLMQSKPFLPLQWPPSGRKTNNPEGEFSQKGQLLIPPERHPRDSGYALYLASLMAGHGDPGRFIEEYRKEHKNRRQGVLLSWAQVEYYQVPSGMKKVLYPPTPEGWSEWECPIGMLVPLPAIVHYRGSRLVRGDPLHWDIFYSEWIVNVLGRFVADAHHRGILWKLPEKVVENIPRLGLEYLLEGSPYHVDTVQQLIRTQVEYDWASWDRKGYHLVGGVPVHLVGSEYLVQDMPPVSGITIAGQEAGDGEEEILDQGRVPEVYQNSHLGDRGDQTAVTPSPALRVDEPRMGNPTSGYRDTVPRLEYRSAHAPPTGSGGPSGLRDFAGYGPTPFGSSLGYRIPRSVPLYPNGEGAASRNTIPSVGERLCSSDDYYGYTWEETRRSNLQGTIRAVDLESQLYPDGMLQEFRELVNSEEWTAETVGQAIRRLIESRTNHRYQAEIQRQRNAALEEALEARVAHDRGTARRLNQLVGEMVSLSVRCQEGPEGGATREGGGEGEGLGEEMTVKRQRADEGGVWGVPRPQG